MEKKMQDEMDSGVLRDYTSYSLSSVNGVIEGIIYVYIYI